MSDSSNNQELVLQDENSKLKRELSFLKVQLQQFQQQLNSNNNNNNSNSPRLSSATTTTTTTRSRSSALHHSTPLPLHNRQSLSQTQQQQQQANQNNNDSSDDDDDMIFDDDDDDDAGGEDNNNNNNNTDSSYQNDDETIATNHNDDDGLSDNDDENSELATVIVMGRGRKSSGGGVALSPPLSGSPLSSSSSAPPPQLTNKRTRGSSLTLTTTRRRRSSSRSSSLTNDMNNNNNNNNSNKAQSERSQSGDLDSDRFQDIFDCMDQVTTVQQLSSVDGSTPVASITEDQRRLKLENVIHSFNKRKWNYLRTPTHPDDNNYTPLHVAFICANENIATFLLTKCIAHEKWYLLTGQCTGNNHRLLIKKSPFDMAFEAGHVDFVRDMITFTRQQLLILERRRALSAGVSNNSGGNGSGRVPLLSSGGSLSVNLNDLQSSPANSSLSPTSVTSPPVSKTVNAFITSRTRSSMRSMSKDDFDVMSARSDLSSSSHSPNTSRTSSNRASSRMSSRSYTVIANSTSKTMTKDMLNEGSDTSTDTVFEELEQDQTIADDGSDSELDENEMKDNRETASDVTSFGRDMLRFDENQYNLGRYSELIQSDKIRTDPLFMNAMSPRPMSADISNGPSSVIEKSYLTRCKIVRSANVFKPGQYFTQSSPVDDSDDDKILYAGLLEDDPADVPHHIKQCIQSVSEEFVVLESSSAENVELVDRSSSLRKRLPELVYEIDLKECGLKERRLITQAIKTKNPFASPDQAPEITVNPLSCDRTISDKYIQQEYNAEERKGFLMDAMDELYPVDEAKRALGMDFDSPDLLLSDFGLKDEYLTTTTDVLICPKSLKLKVFEYIGEPLENLLCTITLYDTFDNVEFTRLTESFTFPATDRDLEKYKALFNVDVIGDNLIAMVKLARKFRGEHTDALNDLYIKGDKAKEKEVTTVKSKFTKHFDYSEDVYSYFAWGAFNVNEARADSNEPTSVSMFMLPNKPGNMHDKFLLQMYANPELRKHRQIPGSLNLAVRELKISPVPRHIVAATGHLVLNLEGVHTPLSRIRSLEYIDSRMIEIENSLTVHPINLNMASRKEAKNLLISVSMRDNDTDFDSEGLPACYPIINNSEPLMRDSGLSFVSQSNPTPDFTEEIKCKIPSKVQPNHHLLFKIYSVSHKDSIMMKSGVKTLVAYAYCYLLNDGRLFHGASEIPVYAVKPGVKLTHYFKLIDGKIEGASLKYKIFANSISHPNDSERTLRSFFTMINRSPDYSTLTAEQMEKSLGSLSSIPAHLGAFAPMMFTELFSIMEQNASEEAFEIRYSAFKTLMRMINTYKAQNPAIVLTYVKYMFKHTNVCEVMIKPMQTLLETESQAQLVALIPRCIWFMFSILLKSIVLHLDQKRNKDMEHDYKFSDSFKDGLSNLISVSLFKYIKKANEKDATVLTHLSAGIGSFLMHLLSILDKDYVMTIAAKYVRNLSHLASKQVDSGQINALDMQLVFFKEFFAYKDYILLFLPQTIEDSLQIVEDEALLEENLSINIYNHFIYSSFVDTVLRSLYNPSRNIRMKAITYLRELVMTTNNDARYQSTEFKQRINQVHFEFVIKFLDIFEEWMRVCSEKKKKASSELAALRKKKIAVESSQQSKMLSLANIKQHKVKSELQSKVEAELTELGVLLKQIDSLTTKLEGEIQAEKPKVVEEKRHLLLVVFHIIQNMNSEVLMKWFAYEGINSSRQLVFLSIFQNVASAFEYSGKMSLDRPFRLIATRRLETPQTPNKKNRIKKPGWGIEEWNDPQKSILLLKQHRQEIRAQLADVKQTDEKTKKNMLSYFKQPRSMSIFSPIFGTTADRSSAKQVKKPDEASPTTSNRSLPTSPKGNDTEAFKEAFVEVRTLREKHMCATSSFYILSSIVQLLEHCKLATKREFNVDGPGSFANERPLLEQFVRTMIYFLHLNQSEKFLIALHSYLRWFFVTYGDILFHASSDFGIMFCESLMALCNSTVEAIREQAAATMYVLIRTSFMVNKGLTKPYILSTVALSRTLQRTTPEDDHLLKSLQGLGQLAKEDPDNPRNHKDTIASSVSLVSDNRSIADLLRSLEEKLKQIDSERMERFTFNIEQLSEQLQKLMYDTISVNQTLLGKDVQKAEDLLFRISAFYERIPELRFLWLKKLAKFHKHQGHYDEAVQCYYRIAAVVFNQLRNAKSPIVEGLPLDNFYNLTPYLRRMKNANDLVQSHLPYSNEFTEKGVIAMIRNIIEAQTLAEQYEHAIPLLKILIPLFEKTEDYVNLSSTHGSIRDMFELINISIKENNRLYSTYYRIRFFGDGWGPELEGKHFIYKMEKLFKLFKMKTKMMELFGNDVEFITSLKIDPSTFVSGKKYLQYTSVKPLLEDDDDEDVNDYDSMEYGSSTSRNSSSSISATRKRTKFESNINISKFYYETAFTRNAKKLSDKVTAIYKRKIVLVVQNSFPDTKTRLPVIDDYERILTPIESAVENMQAQIRKLEEAVDAIPTDLSQLQLVLQGSVRAGVNGGPKDIVESFLPRSERFKYPREHVAKLNTKCQYFLFLCEQALKLHQKMARSNERALHMELEKGFTETKTLFQKHIEDSTKGQALISDYLRKVHKTAGASDLLFSENVEDIDLGEDRQQTEDELDELLPVPYNRNYKLSAKQAHKVVSLYEFLANGLTNDSDSPSPSPRSTSAPQ